MKDELPEQNENSASKGLSGNSTLLCADPRDEFSKLMKHLGATEKMTVGERSNFFAFFCHGFYGRAGEAAYQNESAINHKNANEIKGGYALDMSKLANQLRVKAGVLEMGERKAYRCDAALMREAANKIESLEAAIHETIEDNLHLADGDVCTLIKLKRAINYT